ncbi:MAG: hypothetical protein QM204_06690 [Bacillota bacterium]|jgi:hypothetical protein|nr:hypothetical protein [Bacillota bacterium]NLL26348.1 hypothetical protein [Erysipelotrichia bacterium]
MNEKTKNIYLVILCSIAFFTIVGGNLLTPFKEYSDSERRYLAKFPKPEMNTIISTSWMSDFEKYSQDQFFQREKFRIIKAYVAYNVFLNLDNNGLYQADGYLSKLEYPSNEFMWKRAVDLFNRISNDMFDETNKIYYSIIPDKNYYLAKNNGYLSLDYDKCFNFIKENLSSMQEIKLADLLLLEDFYFTDTHWKQQNLEKIIQRLAEHMDFEITTPFIQKIIDIDFYGVYVGQSALKFPTEKITYLTNEILQNSVVSYLANNGYIQKGIYDFDKAYGKDPYEFFLSGNQAIITIENNNCNSDKELIVFRDSFGSSLCPLLTEGYKKITIVDIRYINSAILKEYITNNGQDVLFIYSTLLINNSSSLK